MPPFGKLLSRCVSLKKDAEVVLFMFHLRASVYQVNVINNINPYT